MSNCTITTLQDCKCAKLSTSKTENFKICNVAVKLEKYEITRLQNCKIKKLKKCKNVELEYYNAVRL